MKYIILQIFSIIYLKLKQTLGKVDLSFNTKYRNLNFILDVNEWRTLEHLVDAFRCLDSRVIGIEWFDCFHTLCIN